MGDSFRPRAPYGDHDRHSENGDFHVGHQPRPPLRWPQQDRFRTSECDSYWSYAHPSNAPPSLNATRNHTSRNHSPTRNQSPHSRSEGGPRSGFTADDFNPDIQRSTLDLSSHISSSSLSQIQPPNSQSDLSPDGDPHFLDTSGSNHDASVSRLFTGSTTNAPREGAPPRWSNPDSETALAPAPTQEAGLKGKNLISMIRHAQEHSAPRDSKISGNDDFVSFDDDSRSRHDGDTDQGFIRQIESLDDLFSDRVLFTGRAIRRGNHAGSKPPQTRNRDFSPPRIPKAWSRERQRESARPGQKRKRSDSPEDADDIVSKWQGNDVPWLDTSVYNDRRHTAVEALNREILDFYSYARPRLFEYDMRRDVIRRLEGFLRQRLKGMEIKSFGSFASGLYLPNADMDFVALTEEYQKCRPNDFKPPFGKKALNTLTGQLRSDAARQQHPSVAKAGSVIAITKARVPLVKYVDAVSGIRVDLSFNNSSGLPAIDICNQWKADIPTLETYVLLVKHLLAMRGLNEVYCGGLGGFSTTCLVYVFLKCLPVDQALDPVKDFGETLMCLLDYYGNRFDISRSGVQTNPPGYFRKDRNPHANQAPNKLAIMDPNNPQNDISSGSHKISTVLWSLSKAHKLLRSHVRSIDPNMGVLGFVFAGDYSHFDRQRSHLERLSRGQIGDHRPQPRMGFQSKDQRPFQGKAGPQRPSKQQRRLVCHALQAACGRADIRRKETVKEPSTLWKIYRDDQSADSDSDY